MTNQYTTTIYYNIDQLHEDWNSIATSNIFLTTDYLQVLQRSAPHNITCIFIGVFLNTKLVGIALSQYIELKKLSNFGDRDKGLKTNIRDFVFRNFASNVLLLGNTMLTGQNAYIFIKNISSEHAFLYLEKAINDIKNNLKIQGKKTHIVSYKDFSTTEKNTLQLEKAKSFYLFCTQPNMIFNIHDNWEIEDDYIADLSKKYRDQYKRARKKSEAIQKRKLSLEDIIKLEDEIYDLYHYVAKNAPFNTFFLTKNHFAVFKEILKDKFLFYGYFIDDKIIGFNTLIKNGAIMETYFLGYQESIQKNNMLYLNMLYDMISYSIKKKFKKIVFARTALEIKSSIGAVPLEMFGFIKHENIFINSQMDIIFKYIEPKTIWNERNPFK